MGNPYDVTAKTLLELGPLDWARLFGLSARQAVVVDADVSTMTRAADKVIHLSDGPRTRLLHIEFQSNADHDLADRSLVYNVLLGSRHRMPVCTVVLLLQPKASHPGVTGTVEKTLEEETEPYLRFRYRLIEVWKMPPEQLLEGGMAILPLAPLGAVTPVGMPALLAKIDEKLRHPPYVAKAGDLWTAIDILLGLRYDPKTVNGWLQGVREMEDSATYQAILKKGVKRGLRQGLSQGLSQGVRQGEREILVEMGTHRLGAPSPMVLARLEAITDTVTLKRLAKRLFEARTWDDLFAGE